MKIPTVVPVIVVDDINIAIDFYKKLGFCEEKNYSFTDEQGRLVHAHLTKDDSVLFLGVPDLSYNKGSLRAKRIEETKAVERGLGVTLIIQTDKLDDIYHLVKSKGLIILYEPTNEWYGDKVFLFLDPFGYEWKVSQSLT